MSTLLIIVSPVKLEDPVLHLVVVMMELLTSVPLLMVNLNLVQSVLFVILNVKDVMDLLLIVLIVKLHSSTEMILNLLIVDVHLTNINIVILNVENVIGNVPNVLDLLTVVPHVEVTEPMV